MFVTQDDIIELNKHGIDFNKFQAIFLKELKEFLLEVWDNKYHKELINLEKYSIENFNKIINYPSYGGYYILEDTFTAVNLNKLSNNTKNLIGYFYGIYLR
tara:strand:- start:821 stop:1123 length:303 start_codon:yes stop_codon:yes gene_type:complete